MKVSRGKAYAVGDHDERPWGWWRVIAVGHEHAIKIITVKPKSRISLQRHEFRSETWVVLQGRGNVTLDGREFQVMPGSCAAIPIGSVHRIENCETEPLVFLEVQLGKVLSENDIVRLEDDYHRV